MKQKSKKPKPQPLRFIVTDLWNCAVSCTENTWLTHIINEHTEMRGKEVEVQAVLKNPQTVYPSTLTGSSFAFEGVSTTDEIRVLVTYEDPSKVTLGNTTGKVQTAYPVDRTKYAAPRIGTPIYVRPAAPAAAPVTPDANKKKGGDPV